MEDALAKRVAQLKAFSGSVKRRNSMYCDIAKIHDRNTAKSLGALHKAPASGKKLQKIGFIMFWVPEPTGITCAIGGPMILAGKYLDKRINGGTIEDIGEQTRATSSTMSDFKNSLL